MGDGESPPHVEESTEPPIRAYPEPQKNNLSNLNNLLPPEIEEIPSKKCSCPFEGSSSIDSENQSINEICNDAYVFTSTHVARALGVDLCNGLDSSEAARRLQENGPNKVEGAKGLSTWKILLRQVSNSLTLVLFITMALSFGIDDFIEGGVITAVILLNIVVGFVQDYRAEKNIMALYALSAPESKVLRNGRIETVKAETLVIGDIVNLSVGTVVPADVRLFEGMNAATDEALLTGESTPVSKDPHKIMSKKNIPLGDRINMAYSASVMTRGRATGIVVATGMDTEVGKIAALLRQNNGALADSNIFVRAWISFRNSVKTILGLVGTPLQVKLSKFALLLFALAILLAIIVFSANHWVTSGEVLIYGIAVAVAVIPESLIAVLTITVAVGTKEMAKGNVIVRKFQALEAVGGVTNICSDKTGTLTQGRMIAHVAWIPGGGTWSVNGTVNPFDPNSGHVKLDGKDIDLEKFNSSCLESSANLMRAISLCNLATVYDANEKPSTEASVNASTIGTNATEEWHAVGDPTEVALQVLAMRFNCGKSTQLQTRGLHLAAEFPFDSSRKRMTVAYRNTMSNTIDVYAKGAVESILPILDISDEEKRNICDKAESMAGEGLRVLCAAHKIIIEEQQLQLSESHFVESNLSFVGLVGLYDPPRVETAEAVKRCQAAGITVHMLTGDHIRTATAIAHEVGILDSSARTQLHFDGNVAILADQFDSLSDDQVDEIEVLPLVVARCTPSTKVRMVEAMHRRGAFCVMTGDGVNDSPALKRADVGIAMGLNGSDVSKEAADMILTDDNFASIVKAVEEGRRLFHNIQKFLLHLLVSNISQVILLLIGLSFKDADGNSVFPLSPLEILWVNLITSSFLALGLGLEEASPHSMLHPPHSLRAGVFTNELITDKMIYGFFIGSLCLASFTSVAYGVGSGNLGSDCNEGWNESCETVFRARATTFSTLSFLLLVTAWEVKHFSRSLFSPDPLSHNKGPLSVFPTIWHNRFLFWAVFAGFVITFPVVYLPVVNHEVFKHSAITWEWGIVCGCVVMYMSLVESWKAIKRRFGIWSGQFVIDTTTAGLFVGSAV